MYSAWEDKHTLPYLLCMWVLGIQIGSPDLHDDHCTDYIISLTPILLLKQPDLDLFILTVTKVTAGQFTLLKSMCTLRAMNKNIEKHKKTIICTAGRRDVITQGGIASGFACLFVCLLFFFLRGQIRVLHLSFLLPSSTLSML